MYELLLHKDFGKKYAKTTLRNKKLKRQIDDVLFQIQNDPFSSGLNTHKVISRNFGTTWSSRITGDLRILWNFTEQNHLVILVLTLGGHSGGNKAYK